ncbi:hypothetical protein BDI4_230051 [Burkholderia diffusa]|nr:hypothetical protein BDI4_230051 [Burkholderia diffusa]
MEGRLRADSAHIPNRHTHMLCIDRYRSAHCRGAAIITECRPNQKKSLIQVNNSFNF